MCQMLYVLCVSAQVCVIESSPLPVSPPLLASPPCHVSRQPRTYGTDSTESETVTYILLTVSLV